MKRFIYFYLNQGLPDKIRPVVPLHVQYWKMASVSEYMGGPLLIALAV